MMSLRVALSILSDEKNLRAHFCHHISRRWQSVWRLVKPTFQDARLIVTLITRTTMIHNGCYVHVRISYHHASLSYFELYLWFVSPHGQISLLTCCHCDVEHGLMPAKAARIASIARPAEDLTSHYGLQEDIHVVDFITSYLLKTCLMKLLPLHSESERCNCNDKHIWYNRPRIECVWPSVERDSACGWAIGIYEKLRADLEAKIIREWWNDNYVLMNCLYCFAERICCKKWKLTLAMTSQIPIWLKKHQQNLIDSMHC